MMQRYSVKFKDFEQNSYEVKIFRDDYVGNVTELRAAPSAFVVSYEDDDFIYKPLRASSATLRVIGSELMLDLYSINSQYAPVKFYKNGVLEWTGYIKPEQFTQPYTPTADVVSVECVSAISTLENVTFEKQTGNGFITMKSLLQYLIREMHGEFSSVIIPWNYGNGTEDYLDLLEIAEENFIEDDGMNLITVLEEVCKFFNVTVTDCHGKLLFVDWDWNTEYRSYDETLSEFVNVVINRVQLQDIGMNGSSSNTIDVVPGYNKASVRSINNVFDEVVKNDDYDKMKEIQRDFYDDGGYHWYKKFLKPEKWEMLVYNEQKMLVDVNQIINVNRDAFGAVAMKEAGWEGEIEDYPWTECIQMRSGSADMVPIFSKSDKLPVFRMYGPAATWKDGAISVDGAIRLCPGLDMHNDGAKFNIKGSVGLRCRLRIGTHYWTGSSWSTVETEFYLPFETRNEQPMSQFIDIKSTKKPEMSYNLSGYIIELPSYELFGQLEFTMLSQNFGEREDGGGFGDFFIYGAVLKDLKFDYARKNPEDSEDEDRVYENVVNDRYLSDCDEISFGIGSYNQDGTTYSKAIYKKHFLEDNLFCRVVGENMRPEELMVRRIVNRYKKTKIKLTESVKIADSISPLTILSDRSMVNNSFRLTSSEWDYEQNRLTVQMQEDTNG